MLVIVLLIAAFYSYQYFQTNSDIDNNASAGAALSAMSIDDVDSIAPTYVDEHLRRLSPRVFLVTADNIARK